MMPLASEDTTVSYTGYKSHDLLTVSNDAKTVKGLKKGYLTGILYGAPAETSGVMNTCTYSTPGCRAACLFTAGRAQFTPSIITGRINKTKWYHAEPTTFMDKLRKDIAALVRKATRDGLTPCVRLNGTTDIPKLAMQLADEFPTVQFYDYTKIPKPWLRTRSNYSLTFSLSESNEADAVDALQHGVNVAVVFAVRKGHALPTHYMGHEVIDGDLTDLRFTDKGTDDRAVVVGVRAKGKAKKDASGFVKLSVLTMARDKPELRWGSVKGLAGQYWNDVKGFVPNGR
jgi:hypothetical protein